MASTAKLAKMESAIEPKLRRFIDRAIIPILVQEYLSIMEQEKQIAQNADDMPLCRVTANAPKVEVAE
jgi:hypothetical protein